MIKKLIVKNFKSLQDFEIDFNEDLNILVGEMSQVNHPY